MARGAMARDRLLRHCHPPPGDFTTSKFWQQKDIDQIIPESIKKGRGAMPAFPDSKISDAEAKELYDYISHVLE